MNLIEFIFKIILYTVAFCALTDNNIKPTNLDWWVILGGFVGGTLIGLDEFQLGDWMFK